jgi:hypothetical protein
MTPDVVSILSSSNFSYAYNNKDAEETLERTGGQPVTWLSKLINSFRTFSAPLHTHFFWCQLVWRWSPLASSFFFLFRVAFLPVQSFCFSSVLPKLLWECVTFQFVFSREVHSHLAGCVVAFQFRQCVWRMAFQSMRVQYKRVET